MNQAIAKQDRPVDLLKATINAPSIQEQFKNALGEHKDTFVASLIDLYTGDKSLQTCKPSAIIIEALRAATLRLPLNKALGFAYIVVYNNSVKVTNEQTGREEWIKVPTPTFIPGYKGHIQLAMRTGQYRTINADVVYEGEVRKVNKLTGEIAFDGEKTSDKIIGYFCYFELLNGFSKTLYVTVEDMAAYAKRYSPSVKKETTVAQLIAKANDGIIGKKVGWEGNFNDMALKTVIRRPCPTATTHSIMPQRRRSISRQRNTRRSIRKRGKSRKPDRSRPHPLLHLNTDLTAREYDLEMFGEFITGQLLHPRSSR